MLVSRKDGLESLQNRHIAGHLGGLKTKQWRANFCPSVLVALPACWTSPTRSARQRWMPTRRTKDTRTTKPNNVKPPWPLLAAPTRAEVTTRVCATNRALTPTKVNPTLQHLSSPSIVKPSANGLAYIACRVYAKSVWRSDATVHVLYCLKVNHISTFRLPYSCHRTHTRSNSLALQNLATAHFGISLPSVV